MTPERIVRDGYTKFINGNFLLSFCTVVFGKKRLDHLISENSWPTAIHYKTYIILSEW